MVLPFYNLYCHGATVDPILIGIAGREQIKSSCFISKRRGSDYLKVYRSEIRI